MFIKRLKLCNYRNYVEEDMVFCENTNILYGENAQGKTNILESIYLCGTTKSHQGSKDKEIIRIGEDEAHIKLFIEKDGLEHKIDMHLKKNKTKGIAINGVPIKKSAELIGFVNMIFFSPEDLNLIKNGPYERRRFMDMELCQLDKIYLNNISKYNKVLSQRNHLLKQISLNESLKDTLSVWDEQLVRYGKDVIKARKSFIEQLEPIAKDINKKLTGGKEDISVIYNPDANIDEYEDKLRSLHDKDIYYQTTNCGPHRDDIKINSNGMDIRTYGSQGQKRTAALTLKMSEIEIVKNKTGDIPILLLDDVLSELDRNRQNYLMDCISNIQTIITCTGLEEFVNYRIPVNQVYRVVNGKVFGEKDGNRHE